MTSPAPLSQTDLSAPAMTKPVPRMNTLAIAGFVLAFFVNIAGLVVSIVALRQIKRTGERGHGLALAGVILSAVFIAFSILLAVISVVAAAGASSSLGY